MTAERDVRRSAADRVLEERRRIAAETSGAISTGRWARDWIRSVALALALFLLVRSFLVEAFRIPTGSMENTLLVGDFLLVNKLAFGGRVPLTDRRLPGYDEPGRGDIIVFEPAHDPGRSYVKRVIGMPGDTLAMRGGTVFVAGLSLAESYAHRDGRSADAPSSMRWTCAHRVGRPGLCEPTRDDWGPIVVPPHSYFVLGDHRDDSEDSRYWGFVDRTAITGRPLLIYYSYEPSDRRPIPWLTRIRWGRIGDIVH